MDPFNPFGNYGQSSNTFPFGQSSDTFPFGQSSNTFPFGQSSNTFPFGQSSNTFPFDQSSDTFPFGQSSNTFPFGQSSDTFPFGQSSNMYEDDENEIYTEEDNGVERQNENAEETNLLEWQVVCTAAAYTLVYYYDNFVHKEPCRTSIRTGNILINEILNGNEARCYQDFRVNKETFISLCRLLVERYQLVPTRTMSEYEEVGIFLMTVAHGCGNRLMQEMFNHSGETIHRHFHRVLRAVCRMASDYIKPASNYNAGNGYHTPQHARYHPYFRDAIGAIDGTHMKCRVPETERSRYFGRKGYATQNILGVCDFNMCFTFAWAGWEGGAHDSRILNDAITRTDLNFPHPAGNKFYLVDAGYAHKQGYMAPYKGARVRYHLPEFRRHDGTARPPRNAKEKFNHLHSSCRMIIERTFGVWKARFAILANMPMYKLNTQTDIVLATMAIHNFIRKTNARDDAFLIAESENYFPGSSASGTNNRTGHGEEDANDDYWIAVRDAIRENIINNRN